MQRLAWVHTMPKAGKRLQLIRDSKARDHRPIGCSINLGLEFGSQDNTGIRWDRDALMAAWHRGAGRTEFLEELEL
eukprot:11102202-Lingulodinium_polyedra.AAC.1